MLAYSLDLRERVVAAYEEGLETISEIAERFAVGQTFVKKMLRQKRETGSLEIKERRYGPVKRLSMKDHEWLRRAIEKEPDVTLDMLRERLAEKRSVQVSRATVGRAIQSLDLPLKKRVRSRVSETIANEVGTGGASAE
jgi:transposase